MPLPLKLRRSRPASLLLLVLLTACGRGSLEVTNLNPVPVMVAIRYPLSADSVVTQGWYRLAPGESRRFVRKFRGVEPAFAVHGHSVADPALMRWLHGQGDDAPGRRYFSGPVPGRIAAAAFAIRAPAREAPGAAPRVAGFAPVPAMNERGRKHRVVLKDERFLDVYRAAAQGGGPDSLKKAASQMARLQGALHHQHWFVRTFKDPVREYPFGLAGLADGNGPFLVGVDIKQVPAATIWGDEYPLQAGDRLLSLDGQPVYSAEDLLSVLWDHATDTLDGGIRKPMAFTALRGAEEVSGKTTYFFNEEHFRRSDREAQRATLVGGFDSFTLGFGCQLRSLFGSDFSRRRRAWNCQQEKARLRQQYHKNYVTGEMLSILIPVGGSLGGVKAARGAGRMRAARGMAVGSVTYTAMRATVSAVNRASPLDGPGEIMGGAARDMVLDLGVQELFATDFIGGG
ncbi:MAG TPA: hypothetical protein VHG08_18350 [Longimicrobium sp.]|nr:hypothetical protein [Longimicrobium sp.]